MSKIIISNKVLSYLFTSNFKPKEENTDIHNIQIYSE